MIRKVILAKRSGDLNMEIWGDGKQTRSFMYIDDCIQGIHMIMDSDSLSEPINLGSAEMVSINELAGIVEEIADVDLKKNYNLDAPKGVRGRSSDNTMIQEVFGWEPSVTLKAGMRKTYEWIEEEIERGAESL
jgi:nucleoside-diphosphate-sugar epimerase